MREYVLKLVYKVSAVNWTKKDARRRVIVKWEQKEKAELATYF